MATRTGTRGKRAPAKRAPGKRRRAGTRTAPPEPSVWERGRESAGRQLGGHGADAAAVALLVLGVLTLLGLVSDAAGAVGSGLADGLGALFGTARYAIPPVCIGFALLFFFHARPAARRAAEAEAAGDEDAVAYEPAPLRVGIGCALLGLASVGALHLAGGSPALDGPIGHLRDAGGYVGGAIAAPLEAGAGTVGASVVLIGFAVLGGLLAPGVPMRTVVAGVGRAARWTRHQARRFGELPKSATGGTAVEGGPLPAVEDQPAVTLYDVDADPPAPEAPPIDPAEAPTLTDVPPVVVEADGQLAVDLGPSTRAGAWKLPPKNLLKKGDSRQVERRLVEEGGKVLEATLHQHSVDARLVGMTIGPTVTVPNRQRQLVTLGDILSSPEAKQAMNPLEVGLGRDIAGQPVMLDLAALPHVLIAGATGAGKSSSINSLVTSLLMRNTPDQVRLILVDPKRVELGAYNDVPHLLTPVVTNPKKAANALDWAVREMDIRYEALADAGVRDIIGYNAAFDRGELPTPDEPDPVTGKGFERLPYIVVVVDELNDLMMVAARDVEASICRIAQMARAVGIHLVIATQRPSVDVITGVIKANVPSRLAFSVTSLADSRVILDQAGAEKLVGQGDMLLMSATSSRVQRIQGSWVDEECVRKVAAHWKRQAARTHYVDGIADDGAGGGGRSAGADADEDDELLAEAMELVVRSGLGSTSMLQRKLRVGFARAGRLMDLLERRGIVGPSEGSKARTVLMTVEELEAATER